MTDPARWKQVEQLFEAAQHEPVDRRAQFLRKVCGGDDELCAEVEALLKAADSGDALLDGSPLSSIAERALALRPGDKLGNFEIVAMLGGGGMGEVYRARDLRLKREVAIKTLPAGFSNNRERVARFEREARAASALNHPNIVTVYDIGQEGGVAFIVSELVEGETLATLLERGPLPLRKLIEVGSQICDGLAAAHAAGVVHRDLKPGNIMLNRDGRVKVLDFGLARQDRVLGAESSTMEVSHPGVIFGTPGYMSPEQVRGESTDARSDIFSLGVILYEMASGKRAFDGNSTIEVMNSILKDDPPELPGTVPSALVAIIGRCMEKQPDRRFQSAADLEFVLRVGPPNVPGSPPKKRAWTKWAVGASLILVLFAVNLAFWLTRPLPVPRATRIQPITYSSPVSIPEEAPLLSDGSRIFFYSCCAGPTFQVPLKGGETVPLISQLGSRTLFLDISADHTEFLVCRYGDPGPCQLWAEPTTGGSPRRLGTILSDARDSASWSPDGKFLVYSYDGEIWIANHDGAESRKLASFKQNGGYLRHPRWSPDSRRIRFVVMTDSSSRIWEVRPDDTGLQPVLPKWNPDWHMDDECWTPNGKYFMFLSDDRIWLVRDKPDWIQRASDEPSPLEIGPIIPLHPLPSADGKRLFFEGRQPRSELVSFDSKTRLSTFERPGLSATELETSLDGKSIAYVTRPKRLLFTATSDGTQRIQITSPPLSPSLPRWSPDGKQIAFMASNGGSASRIYVASAGAGELRQVTNGEAGGAGDADPSWSPDGLSLAFGSALPAKPDMQIHTRPQFEDW